MPIAANAPIIMIQTGRLEGRLKASNTPVRIAEPSQRVGFLFHQESLDQILEYHTGQNRYDRNDQRSQTEEIKGYQESRDKGNQYTIHIFAYAVATMDVGRGRYV